MKSCARFGGVARGRVARTVMGTGRMPTTRAGRRDGETAPTRRERTRGRERASTTARASMGTASTDASEASKMELWWRAVKLPMYSVAWVPLLCAAALTYCQHGVVHGAHAMRATLGATLVIAWLNLSNDAFDASTNVDARKPESVVSLTGGKTTAAHAAAVACLASGLALLWRACAESGNSVSWKALLGAIAMGYAYQGPPFRLSYKGLGEPLCFVAFGPLATVAFYVAMAGKVTGGAAVSVPPIVGSVAVLIGCSTAFILFTSHFHQEEGDRAAGKLSPVVRLGLPGALLVADNLIGAHYATIATLAAAGWLPYTAVFGLIVTYPLARHIVDFAQNRVDAGAVSDLFFTKYLAVRFHIIHGILLAIGIVAQRLLLSTELFFP